MKVRPCFAVNGGQLMINLEGGNMTNVIRGPFHLMTLRTALLTAGLYVFAVFLFHAQSLGGQ